MSLLWRWFKLFLLGAAMVLLVGFILSMTLRQCLALLIIPAVWMIPCAILLEEAEA